MVLDSGASISALPKEVGKGFPIVQDEHSGYDYLGAGEEKIKDEGTRTLQFVDENWTTKNLNHRVAKMRNPLVAASQTVAAGNLIMMSEANSFVVPKSSQLGWELDKAVKELKRKFGTGDCTTLYERNGIYCFDAWVKPGPGLNSVAPRAQVTERSVAAARGSTAGKGPPSERVGAAEGGSASARTASLRLDDNREKPKKEAKVNDDVEEEEFEVEDGNGMTKHPRWQTPQGKRKATKKFMSSYSSGPGHGSCCDEDGQCNANDDGYWSGFTRLVPHWP